jgi:hypothetical protein
MLCTHDVCESINELIRFSSYVAAHTTCSFESAGDHVHTPCCTPTVAVLSRYMYVIGQGAEAQGCWAQDITHNCS